MFHRLNGNLLLLNTLKGLLQLRNLLFAFLTLKFQNAEVLLVFAFVLQFDTVLQHDCSKEFFLLLYSNKHTEEAERLNEFMVNNDGYKKLG